MQNSPDTPVELEDQEPLPNGETLISEFSEAHDDATASTDDSVLSIKGNGIIGCLERIPLIVKLISMNSITNLGLLFIAIYLMFYLISTYLTKRVIVSLVNDQVAVTNLIRSLGEERIAAALLITNKYFSRQDNVRYSTAINVTDARIRDLQQLPQLVSIYDSGVFRDLADSRAAVVNQRLDGNVTYLYYNYIIDSIIDSESRITQDRIATKQNGITIDTNFASLSIMNMVIYESVSRMGALGNYLFGVNFEHGNNNPAYDEFETEYAKYGTLRRVYSATIDNTILQLFSAFNSTDPDANSAISDVLKSEETAVALVENGVVSRPASQRGVIDPFGFNGNMTKWLQGINLVVSTSLGAIKNQSDQEAASALAALVVVIIILVLIIITGLITGLLFSKTITGPWARMVTVQKNAVKKFVPAGFLKLVDCKQIQDVNVGKNVERSVAMMLVEIKRFDVITGDMEPKKALVMLNEFLSHACPHVRIHNGFVDRYNHDGFSAVFKSKKGAIAASLAIQREAISFSHQHTDYPKIEPSVCIHANRVLVGTVGENERMDGVILSREARFTSEFIRFNENLCTSIICSKNVTIQRMPNFRYLGKSLNRSQNVVELYELFDEQNTARTFNVKQFTEATSALDNHLYYQARGL